MLKSLEDKRHSSSTRPAPLDLEEAFAQGWKPQQTFADKRDLPLRIQLPLLATCKSHPGANALVVASDLRYSVVGASGVTGRLWRCWCGRYWTCGDTCCGPIGSCGRFWYFRLRRTRLEETHCAGHPLLPIQTKLETASIQSLNASTEKAVHY